jgi:hypothetical protein
MACTCCTHRSEAQKCCICLGNIGWFDRVVHLEKCGHRLHERCHTQLVSHHEPAKGITQNPLTAPKTHRCPLCRAAYENTEEDVTVMLFPHVLPCARHQCCTKARWNCFYLRKTRRLSISTRRKIKKAQQFALDMLKLIALFTLLRVMFPCRATPVQDNLLSFQITCDGGVLLGITIIFCVIHSILRCCRRR